MEIVGKYHWPKGYRYNKTFSLMLQKVPEQVFLYRESITSPFPPPPPPPAFLSLSPQREREVFLSPVEVIGISWNFKSLGNVWVETRLELQEQCFGCTV